VIVEENPDLTEYAHKANDLLDPQTMKKLIETETLKIEKRSKEAMEELKKKHEEHME